jgi:hypothetical protein
MAIGDTMATTTSELDDAEIRDSRVSSARQILLQAALLGVLADNTIRNTGEGRGWTIWVAALVVAVLLVVRRRGEQLKREQLAWLGAAVVCAVAFAWRDSEMLQAANVLGTLVALALASMAFAGAPAPSILAARLRDLVAAGVYSARDVLGGVASLIFRDAALGSAIRTSAVSRRPILRAALLTIPLLFVFIPLLSRADPVFESIFRLPEVDVETILSHIVLMGVFAWGSAGWMRGTLLPGSRPRLPDRLPLTIGSVEVGASLGAVAALFAIFVGLQLRWLFGGADVVQATTGLSVAEYARRGFFELVTVAALVFPLVLLTRAAIGDDDNAIRVHRRFSLLLLVLLGAIIASAILRMRLYVSNFGLTTDRLTALVFMLWLAVVFTAMALTMLRGWSRPFATMTIVSGFATLLAYNAANPDRIVARINLARTPSASRPIDYEYLARLSGDAMPLVAKALATAEASSSACTSAKKLRARWLVNQDKARSNLGAARGRVATLEFLTPAQITRLCGLTGGQT